MNSVRRRHDGDEMKRGRGGGARAGVRRLPLPLLWCLAVCLLVTGESERHASLTQTNDVMVMRGGH